MASLSSLVVSKTQDLQFEETNIEKGTITTFLPGTVSTNREDFNEAKTDQVWTAPGTGIAVIEVWGASGSAGYGCCCGVGIPGNPGAYAKKTVNVVAGCTVTMNLGDSCYQNTLCYKGRSEPTCVCYDAVGTDGTIVAEGGRGGVWICVPSSGGAYCCSIAAGLPGQTFADLGAPWVAASDGCGLICNYVAGEIANATGGDINLSGGYSCMTMGHCNTCCQCKFVSHMRTSPGIVSQCGNTLHYNHDCGFHYARENSSGPHQALAAMNAISRTPSMGQPYTNCWSNGRHCESYDNPTAQQYIYPHGMPASGTHSCVNTRNYGTRGGPGAVRIQFIGT
jgi:hypothetical protein